VITTGTEDITMVGAKKDIVVLAMSVWKIVKIPVEQGVTSVFEYVST
jgi:hypothetical protein